MDTVSPLVYRHAPRIAALIGWVAFLGCLLVLLAFAVLVIAGHVQGLGPDPRLAPFRWVPAGNGQA